MTAGVPRKTDTRQALIDAALDVFLRRGFARATTREIAQTAGVAEGTIYRHFADKYALFHEVFLALTADVGAELLRLPERAGNATVRDNLEHVFVLVGSMQAQLSSLMASMWADPELEKKLCRPRPRARPGGVRTAGTGVAAGRVRPRRAATGPDPHRCRRRRGRRRGPRGALRPGHGARLEDAVLDDRRPPRAGGLPDPRRRRARHPCARLGADSSSGAPGVAPTVGAPRGSSGCPRLVLVGSAVGDRRDRLGRPFDAEAG